jgi:hypothetical protein
VVRVLQVIQAAPQSLDATLVCGAARSLFLKCDGRPPSPHVWRLADRHGAMWLLPVGHRNMSWSVGRVLKSRAAGGVTDSASQM